MTIKSHIRRVFQKFGYDITRIEPDRQLRQDLQRLVSSPQPTILDVGASLGQSITRFKSLFPNSLIHSFEPSPEMYKTLESGAKKYSGVHTVNAAVGSACGRARLFENSSRDMNSLLPKGKDAWGDVLYESEVDVITLDDYCSEAGIRYIDLLKIDTQGSDLSVLQGASRMFDKRGITLVLTEVTFSQMYVGAVTFDEQFKFLTARGFQLVDFYGLQRQNGFAGWADALFYLS